MIFNTKRQFKIVLCLIFSVLLFAGCLHLVNPERFDMGHVKAHVKSYEKLTPAEVAFGVQSGKEALKYFVQNKEAKHVSELSETDQLAIEFYCFLITAASKRVVLKSQFIKSMQKGAFGHHVDALYEFSNSEIHLNRDANFCQTTLPHEFGHYASLRCTYYKAKKLPDWVNEKGNAIAQNWAFRNKHERIIVRELEAEYVALCVMHELSKKAETNLFPQQVFFPMTKKRFDVFWNYLDLSTQLVQTHDDGIVTIKIPSPTFTQKMEEAKMIQNFQELVNFCFKLKQSRYLMIAGQDYGSYLVSFSCLMMLVAEHDSLADFEKLVLEGSFDDLVAEINRILAKRNLVESLDRFAKKWEGYVAQYRPSDKSE